MVSIDLNAFNFTLCQWICKLNCWEGNRKCKRHVKAPTYEMQHAGKYFSFWVQQPLNILHVESHCDLYIYIHQDL